MDKITYKDTNKDTYKDTYKEIPKPDDKDVLGWCELEGMEGGGGGGGGMEGGVEAAAVIQQAVRCWIARGVYYELLGKCVCIRGVRV